MSKDEIPYWVGFLAGVVACGLTLRALEQPQWVVAIGSMVSGVAVGMIVDVLWKRANRPPPPSRREGE